MIFPISAFTHETFSSVHLVIKDSYNVKLGSGTGFIGKFANSYHLITAKHVALGLTSSDYQSGAESRARFIDTNCFLIGRHDARQLYMENRSLSINLYTDARSRNWKEFLDWDIVSFDITEQTNDAAATPVSIDLSEVSVQLDESGTAVSVSPDEMLPPVTSEIFIVGYPANLSYLTHDKAPIWKRASISSEPHLRLDDRPIFLVDTQGAKGLSGSPVLYRGDSLISPYGSRRTREHKPQRSHLVGIYCGREGYSPDAVSLSLGRVFKRSAIQTTIMEPSLAD